MRCDNCNRAVSPVDGVTRVASVTICHRALCRDVAVKAIRTDGQGIDV